MPHPEIATANNGRFVTQINVVEVAPENQARLLELMTAQVEEVMRHRPGFISSSLHRAHDGSRVVNYVQWETQEGLDAAHAHPDFLAHLARYKDLVLHAGPRLYEVALVRHA